MLTTSHTLAGLTPEQNCQATENMAAAKYAACRHSAEAKLASTGNATKYNPSHWTAADRTDPVTAPCENARKRLPSNAEWQAAVIGTPDPGPDNGTTDCNSTYQVGQEPTRTGSRSGCVSSRGAFDMVGNLHEWVADWVPRSTVECGTWSADVSPTDDDQCLAGAATTGEPGALLRGGGFRVFYATNAGPLAVDGSGGPSVAGGSIGFRCAR